MTDPELLAEYDRRFREDPDPWSFESSQYEQEKRATTIAACEQAVHGRVLELGAANGVLAADLARTARHLVAVEGAPAAAALARDRLATAAHAQVVEGLIPAAVPSGPYDLVVASEILYYLDEASYTATLEQLPRWLAPDARLVAVHWRTHGPERPRTAGQVHADLAAHPALLPLLESPTDDFLLTVLTRARQGTDAVQA